MASCAVGVGVAFARNGGRRPLREDRSEPELGLQPGEGLADGLTRMAREQSELAIRLLDGAGESASAKAVHETRKAMKRLRTLLRLVRDELGDPIYPRDAALLRSAAARLSGARDAEVMLATLDRLVDRHPKSLARRRGVRRLRSSLHAEALEQERRTIGDPAARAAAVVELRAFRRGIDEWAFLPVDGTALVEPGLRRVYRQGRSRHERAARGKGDQVVAMHEWRKRVKDLRYAAEALHRIEPRRPLARLLASRNGAGPTDRSAAKAANRRLRRLARRSDRLGETLGEDHDLALLADRVRAASRRSSHGGRIVGRGSRRALLKLIARRRRRLRRSALREGARLYSRRPKRFVRRVAADEAAAGALS